jgi:hypothetical protein
MLTIEPDRFLAIIPRSDRVKYGEFEILSRKLEAIKWRDAILNVTDRVTGYFLIKPGTFLERFSALSEDFQSSPESSHHTFSGSIQRLLFSDDLTSAS